MLVLRRRVVEVFGSDDEGSQEDSMSSARHAFRSSWKSFAQSLEVDQGTEKGRYLNIALLNEDADEGFEGWKSWIRGKRSIGEGALGGCRRRSRQAKGSGRSTLDNRIGFCCKMRNHLCSDW